MTCTLLSKKTKTVSRSNHRVDDDEAGQSMVTTRPIPGSRDANRGGRRESLSSALKSNARSVAWEESV